jgi:hypothetical protein
MSTRNTLYTVAVLFAVALAVWLIAGCSPVSKGVWDGSTHIEFRTDGSILIEREGKGTASVAAPTNAASPGRLDITEAGIVSTTSGTWEEKAIDYASKNTWIFYAGAVACVIGAAVAFLVFRQTVLAAALGLAGTVFIFAPDLIKRLGAFVAIIIGGLILLGFAYAFGKMVYGKLQRQRAAEAEAKLIREGRPAEATAVRRAVDGTLDRAFRKQAAADKSDERG